ncbi:MAG: ribosomal RNA small subunit methyltransferase A [Elusimicrobia bacterium]|nr:ribosomal RNA small subunit methyltransferase A [Elusimicrobiota bacterium]
MARKLGQHFLINPDTSRRIADLLSLEPSEKVLEIGPGRGALTDFLLDEDIYLTAVELDKYFADKIQEKYGDKVRVINEDFLKINLADFSPEKICGNLPYQITGPILEKVLTDPYPWTRAVFMIPDAVARRATAAPGDSDYSAISVMTGGGFSVNYAFSVPPEDFDPPPKIESGVIVVIRESGPEDEKFYHFTRAAFSRRRKKLRNSLSISLELSKDAVEAVLKDCSIDGNLRPQDLSFKEYKRLFTGFVKNKLF